MELAPTAAEADGSCRPEREWEIVRTAIGIAALGALGALARYGVDLVVSRRAGAFPWATFAVNVTGAFALGFLVTLFAERTIVAPWLRAAIAIGFLGGYTTFSTYSLESYRLLADGAHALALANVLGSAAAGLLAVYLGVVTGRSF